MLQFKPDADIYTPETILSAQNIQPSLTGYESVKSYQPYINTELTDIVQVDTLSMLSEAKRTFISTETEVYELINGATFKKFDHNESVSSTSFVSLGDASLMTNGVDKIAVCLSTADFIEITEAPKANIIVESGGFIVAFNYTSSTEQVSDGWWSSGLYEYATWTPAIGNLAAYGRLTESSGDIVAASSFNDGIVAFKPNSMYVGQFGGIDTKWTWQVHDSSTGCIGQNALTNTPIGLVWVSKNDVLVFDGNSIKSIADGIKYWLFENMNKKVAYKIRVVYDQVNKLIHIGYPSLSSEYVDSNLIYDIDTNRWGINTFGSSNALPFEYSTGDVTIDSISDPIDSLTNSFDSLLYKGGELLMCYADSSGTIYSQTGNYLDASMLFNVVGTITADSMFTSAVPIWSTLPSSSIAKHYYSDSNGSLMKLSAQAVQRFNKYSMRKLAKYHQLRIETIGKFSIYSVTMNLLKATERT